jgi:hypothetical protein
MTSTSGTFITAHAAGARSADEAAVGALSHAATLPSVSDVEPSKGLADRQQVSRSGPAGTRRPSMPAEQHGRQVKVVEDGEVVAVADVEPADDQGVVRAVLHAQAGHLPTGTRTRLVDAVLDLPQTNASSRLEATLPLGDAESLDRLRERCDEVQTRPAGASCLVDAALSTDPAGAPTLEG